jgi:hypothetical protein
MAAQTVILFRYPRHTAFWWWQSVSLAWSVALLVLAHVARSWYVPAWRWTAPVVIAFLLFAGIEVWAGRNLAWSIRLIVSILFIDAFMVSVSTQDPTHRILIARGIVVFCIAGAILVTAGAERTISPHQAIMAGW